MIKSIDKLEEGKKIFFASDFHLGTPSREKSFERELKIIAWLDRIKHEAHSIHLLGDVFDFWFEYKKAIPKGFIRFQGKLAEIRDSGIEVTLFTGNHDMWMFDYFPKELDIPVYRNPQEFSVDGTRFMIGHGDGLGPGDFSYKILKKIFDNKLCQWAFERLHPNLGISIAHFWSRRSRIGNEKKEDKHLGEDEWLLTHCREVEKVTHHDYYIFGHRHLPLDLKVNENSRYINLGEWVNYCTYGEYDGTEFKLLTFEGAK
ncbi:UDP-2,3-diacylglucosamine diphosphatase [Fulvivirgaceae bacterium BMA10]|uniref:UDP-2,3-diacylglucosamine diphosphatase n=1 Tax=Splendidivirga corallicola TaxID=3051826 RepID=A0ABT8L0L2_9BACT|nr:UDP-2,3-diacylglucosamine diphosphatase [Fulvivirgaceae bacterium BMA10]